MFNVKEAVLGWMSGELNLGLLITISTVFKKKMSIEFSRRNDHHNKQPILVLFDDINSNHKRPVKPPYYAYKSQEDEEDREMEEEEKGEEDNEKEEVEKEEDEEKEENLFYEKNEDDLAKNYKRKKQQQGARFDGQPEEVLWANRHEPEFFQRQKRRREKDKEKSEQNESVSYDDSQDQETEMLALEAATTGRRRRDTTSSRRRSNRIVSKNRTSKIQRVLTSMDIYERAEFRERLGQTMFNQSTKIRRLRRSNNQNTVQANSTETCTRHELNVDFADIGLSSIIVAPANYAAYQCKGKCESPLTQDHQPTNHATIQAIVHKMGLVQGVEKPCCVPTKLQSVSILYLENEHVVLKKYEDMVAERCGCR